MPYQPLPWYLCHSARDREIGLAVVGVGDVDLSERSPKAAGRGAPATGVNAGASRDQKFADSLLEGTGFGPVCGISCQVVFLVVAGSLFGAEKPFLVPSPAIRFAERAEGVKGPKR
jgi:hypothetical protein